jgi:hypothetical protein
VAYCTAKYSDTSFSSSFFFIRELYILNIDLLKTRTRSKTINYTGKKKSGAGMDTWKERNVSYIRDENKFTNNVFI